jgi:RNA polymerase sigma-70 factor (ECF subfamily)
MNSPKEEALPIAANQEFVPTEETKAAWSARAYLMAYGRSDPESEQATLALQMAKDEFETAYKLTHPTVRQVVYSRTGYNEDATNDVVQGIYFRAWKGLRGFRGDSQFTTWLYRITLNELSNYYKKAKREPLVGDELLELPDMKSLFPTPRGTDPEAAAIDNDFMRMLQERSPTLTALQISIIIKHHIQGWRHRDIAAVHGISEDNSKVILHRAKAILKMTLVREKDQD